MLARQNRLKRSPLFPKTMGSGVRLCASPYFLMLALPRQFESDTPTRFGFIVSKKVSNRSNKRNLARRRLREVIRTEILPQNPEWLKTYIAVVCIARPAILEAQYAQIKAHMLRCVTK